MPREPFGGGREAQTVPREAAEAHRGWQTVPREAYRKDREGAAPMKSAKQIGGMFEMALVFINFVGDSQGTVVRGILFINKKEILWQTSRIFHRNRSSG